MKKITARLISAVLSLALVMSLVQLISVTADSSVPTANIVDMQFSLSEYDKTYDNGINTYWKIVLTGDQNIGFGDSTYWQINLQQYMIESQSTEKDNWEEHNALADILRENIYINGISIAEGLATDPVNQGLSTRIQAGDSKYSSTKNKLIIYVRAEFVAQLDNTYGLNDYTDFTLEIKEGITLNGFAINPIKYKYHADSQLITVDDGTISVNSVDFKYNSDYNNSKYHLFNVNLSDKISDTTAVSQDVLQEHITINGKTVKQGLKDKADSTIIYTGSADTGDADMLYIAVKTDNDPYGINPSSSFDIEVKEGISFGEYTLTPVRYYFNSQTKRMVADDGSVEFVSATLTEEASYITGGTERGPVWVITLKTSPEKDIQVVDKNVSYWGLNLQQMMIDSQGDYYAEHNNQAELLRNKIFINGVSVDTALKSTNDCTTLINTPDANTLVIRINKEKDVYGINLKKGFSLSLRSGLKLAGTPIFPTTYNYSEDGFEIEGALAEEVTTLDPTKAYITSATVTEGASCEDNHNSENWIIGIDFDKEIYDSTVADKRGANTDYYTSHLQSDTWLADNTSSYTELRRYILINGKALTDCYIDGAYSSWEKFVHISTDDQNKNRLIVSIPKDNSFNFDGTKDFEITILSGITLNGYKLDEKTVSCSGGNATVSDLLEAKKSEYSKATALDASIEEISKGYCSNHRTDSQWVVTIDFDKNLYASDIYSAVSGGNDYYRRHMQAEGWTATAERESTPAEILSLISINGKSLKNCYAECTSRPFSDAARFAHISANDATGKTLTIAIPTENPYGFDGTADFKISVGKGLKINGYTLSPFILTYTANTNSFSVMDCSSGIPSNITNVDLLTEGEKTWVIELTTEQDITVSGNGAGDLQFVARQKSADRKALSQAIIDNITINGETIAESIARVGTNYPVRISANENKLYLKINKKTATTYDNDFAIGDKEDFTVCIRDEILFGDVLVQPVRWRYDAESGEFIVDNSEDIKNIASPLLTFTGTTRETIDSEGNRLGILLWAGGGSRYADFYVDSLIRGKSLNSEIFNDAHGESVRNCIYVDGISVNEWLEYGNQFQVMVRFEENYIRFLLDGTREPSLIEDENHWIEFKEGLISATGERVSPCKFYYDSATRIWTVVDSYEDCNKPWWVENFEQKSEFAEAGKQDNPSYVRPELDWSEEIETEETVITDEEENYDESEDWIDNSTDTEEITDSSDTTENETENQKEKVTVVKKKKVKGEVIYENYIPTGVIVAIIVGAILVIGGVISIIIIKVKKKRRNNI